MVHKVKNLERHGRFFRVQFWRNGKRHVVPLNTADVGLAINLRNQIMAGDDLITEALGMRAAGHTAVGLRERVWEIQANRGDDIATAYVDAVDGFATPWKALPIESWHTEGNRKTAQPHSTRTRDDAQTALRELERFIKAKGKPLIIEAVTPELAAQWKMQMQADGVHIKTIKKKISIGNSLWTFTLRNNIVKLPTNPFKGLSPPVPTVPDTEREQPILDMGPVLSRWPDKDSMGQVVRMMALSGMRPEEAAQLRCRDAEGGWFNIRKSKTTAGVRKIPIHSKLKPLIARLRKNREPDDFLIEHGGVGKRGRATVFTKAFGYAAPKMGIAVKVEGKRRGLINLYSIKRRATAILEWNDVPESTVARLLGHRRDGFNSFEAYNPMGPQSSQLRAAIELLHLKKIKPQDANG